MALPQVYEGTAQEIAEQIRGSSLAGKLKAIITPDEYETASTNGTSETLDKALASLLEEADKIEREMPVSPTDPHEITFGEIITEKYRKMGFKS